MNKYERRMVCITVMAFAIVISLAFYDVGSKLNDLQRRVGQLEAQQVKR